MKIKASELWGIKAYQFKLYMFLRYVDSNIDVENEREMKGLGSYLRIPPDLLIQGFSDLVELNFITFDYFGIKINEVDVYE
ncbi:MAG: hypothetical protein GY760_29180 [Deltaproteobacteria bacterium]|nr:hypothetical protein [Deltaproteobacteria bacterium]